MQETPKANRMHIGIFGKRNAGKSSLINALTSQNISVVSQEAGTTTDPVYKAMELLPIGPVVIIDTAGIDDFGDLGQLRIDKTKEVLNKTDLALLVFDYENKDVKYEFNWYERLKDKNIPIIGVISKIDKLNEEEINRFIKDLENKFKIPFVSISAKLNKNIHELKETIIKNAPGDYERDTIVGDIIKAKDLVVLVAPQDIQAPKGRLILPQVQVIRDILDNGALALTVKDTELKDILKELKRDPDLVITDSQVFKKVNEIIKPSIPLTSFSILMARYKGDLKLLLEGAYAIDSLKKGDKVLIAEACTHHSLKGDIAREKLPMWLEEKVGEKLKIDVCAGIDFKENLNEYKLIIHCGGCMFNRKQLINRLEVAKKMGVPITNFGIAIAHINGILNRVVEIFNV